MDIIIGAGVSGLSYANFIEGNNYRIFEKDSEIGGYCKTIKQDGFTWDYSGHFFHFRNPEIERYIFSKMDESSLLKVNKNTQIKYQNSYIDFPFQANIHQLPKEEFIDCLVDLFDNNDLPVSNFEEMVISKFGKSIAEKFLIPYNEKLYACKLNMLDKDAMGRFFPYANREEIIKGFRQVKFESYNNYFVYPKGGAIEYINALNSSVEPKNIQFNEGITQIDLANKEVHTNKGSYKFTNLISSMPFPLLLKACTIEYDESLYSWNKVLVFNLGFNKKGNDTKNHWVYFPEKKYSFYRIGYYDNIFNDDRMSLYVELGFNKYEQIDSQNYLETVLNDLKEAGVISDEQELISYHSVVMDPAYVHINTASNLDVINKKKILAEHNVYSIGRYGSWTYCSIEDNIIEAKALAEEMNKQ